VLETLRQLGQSPVAHWRGYSIPQSACWWEGLAELTHTEAGLVYICLVEDLRPCMLFTSIR